MTRKIFDEEAEGKTIFISPKEISEK